MKAILAQQLKPKVSLLTLVIKLQKSISRSTDIAQISFCTQNEANGKHFSNTYGLSFLAIYFA